MSEEPSVSDGCVTKIVVEDGDCQSVFEFGPETSRALADMLRSGIPSHLEHNVCTNNEDGKARAVADTVEDATEPEALTDGGRDHSFPSDDLWSDYRDAEIGVGDVVVDLSRGVSLQVTSVATKHAGEHPDVRSDPTADMFGVDDDELVFNCVFLPDGDDAVSPPSKTYAYPQSRLMRYPVEEATSRARLQREWLTNLLEDLAVEANELGAQHLICLREVVSEAFGSEVAGLLEEFVEAAGGETA